MVAAFWKSADLEGPIPLMNRDNAAAAAGGSSDARSRAENISQAGGVKTASLADALLNNKDDKKGHHDTFHIYFESILGYVFSFPDTSNTRYQSYCHAACALILHLEHYISFLELIRYKKESGLFNHMEQNVYKALHDIPTLTELCVLSLYSLAISAPYMHTVRGPGQENLNVFEPWTIA